MHRFIVPALALTFLLGLFIGSTVTASFRTPPPMAIVQDPGTDVPVVRIDGIRDSALVGNVLGGVRVVADGVPIPVDGSGSFAVRDSDVLTNVVTVRPPEGMQFIASKRGKKYYPLHSAEATRLAPENRVYFPDAEAAEKAGYHR